MFIRVDPSTLPSPPPGGSGFALPPQEQINKFLEKPRDQIFGDCTVETQSSAEAFDKAVETIAIATSESFADLDADCGTATAVAQANARAVATAVAEAGASTKVILTGNCSEDAAGLATAKAEANATAVAIAFVQAIAEARANSTEALDIKEVEQVEAAFETAVAESTTVVMGGSEETSGVDDVVVNKTAKIVSSILVKAVAEVICKEEEPEEVTCTCSDFLPPGSKFTCAEQRDMGNCGAGWMRDISVFLEGYCQTTCRLCPCANPSFKPDSPTVPVPLPPEDVFEEKPLPPKIEGQCTCTDTPPKGATSTCADLRELGKCDATWMRSTSELPEGFCQTTCDLCPCTEPTIEEVLPKDPDSFPDVVFLCGEGECQDTPVIKDANGIAIGIGPVEATGPLGVPGNYPLGFGICGKATCLEVPVRTL